MHHPFDALGGVLLGIGCLLVALVAVRVFGIVAERRHREPGDAPRSLTGGDGVKVAVVAHSGKSFGGGLPELRAILERRGIHDLRWREVPKSRKAPKQVRKALEWGAELIFLWGGDGLAQRSIDALDGSERPSRSCRRGRRTCSRRASGSRRTSRRRWTSACAASAAGSTSGASTARPSR